MNSLAGGGFQLINWQDLTLLLMGGVFIYFYLERYF